MVIALTATRCYALGWAREAFAARLLLLAGSRTDQPSGR